MPSKSTMLLVLLAGPLLAVPLATAAVAPADPQQGDVVVRLKTVNEDDEPDDVLAVVSTAHNIEPGGPWLGIQFGPVPKPLAAHLALDAEVGQMVLNVVEDSPADQAGLQQYDVIVRVDGQDVSADIAEFLDVVRGFAPNENHSFSLLRGGRSIDANVSIGTRPDSPEAWEYKFESEPPEVFGGQFFQRGGLLEKDDQGNWKMQRFTLPDSFDHIWQQFPAGDPLKDFAWHGQLNFDVEKGRSVRIERNEDGQITVTKTEKENGKESTTTNTYADEAEFEQKDPETYKLYNNQFGAGGGLGFHFRHGGPGRIFMHRLDDDDLDLDIDIDEIMKETEEAIQEAMKGQGLHDPGHGKLFQRAVPAPMFIGKPKTSFERNADGSIRVTTRQGGRELVETFASADALKEARPKLYEMYQELQDAQAEWTPER